MDEVASSRILSWGSSRTLRSIGLLVLPLALLGWSVSNPALAEGGGGLPDEAEEAFQAFVDEVAALRLETVAAGVEKYAGGLADELDLDASVRKRLAEGYPEIIAATEAAWREGFESLYRRSLAKSKNPIEVLEGWEAKSFAQSPNGTSVRPDRTEAWRAVLSSVLKPEQLAEYDAAEKAKETELRKELEDHLLRCREVATSRMEPIMDAEIMQFKTLAKIDEARLEKLDAAAQRAIEGTVEAWLDRWEQQVLNMEDAERKQRTGGNSFPPLDTSGEADPKQHKDWEEALAQVLSEEELADVAKRRADRRRARAEALAMLLVDELEPLVGFTAEQRSQLTGQFAGPMLTLPEQYFTAQAPNSYYSIDPGQLLSQISGVVEPEVLALLDDGQSARWKGVTPQNLTPNRYPSGGSLKGLEIPPAELIDPIEAQRLITAYMFLNAKEYTRNHRARMDAMVAGIARVAELGPEEVAVLRTAAKGAAQALAKNEIDNFENWARQNLQNVAPADLPARLKSRSRPHFSSQVETADPPILKGALDRILTPEQRERWGREREARRVWGRDCRVALLMTEIDKTVLLEPGKRELLEDCVESVLADYQPELDRMFSFQWHTQGYYNMIPLSLISDEELAKSLDKEQVRLLRSRNPGHFDNMIDNLKRNHKQRRKAEKE